MPNNTCYLSLNHIEDPIYAFKKQFSGLTDSCASPIQCPYFTIGSSNRRRLLGPAQRPPAPPPPAPSCGFGATSDMRLKTNIVPTGRYIASLPEYTWEWNDVAKALLLDGHPTVGVMAQEAQAVHPQAVSTCADGYLRVDYGLLSRLSL